MTPRYQHDCENCIFMGKDGRYDLYFCPRVDHGSVIARFGDDPGDYGSSPVSTALTMDPAVTSPEYANEPHVAYFRLAQRLLQGDLVTVELNRTKIAEHRISHTPTWDDVYRAFYDALAYRLDVEEKDRPQEAFRLAEKYCRDSFISDLIPPPEPFRCIREAEEKVARALLSPMGEKP